jgi:rubrerythrin
MELIGILIITIGGLFFIGVPLFTDESRWKKTPPKRPSRQEELQTRKNKALSAIKELEFDYRTGKLSPEDYASLRARYEKEAVESMKLLDGLEQRGKKFRTNNGKRDSLICSSCGEEVPSSSRFCPNCGTRFDGAPRSA